MDPIAHTCLDKCPLRSAGALLSQCHKIFQTAVTVIILHVYMSTSVFVWLVFGTGVI